MAVHNKNSANRELAFDHCFMNCISYQNELEDFLSGELDAAQQAAIEAHLSGCTNCRVELRALEQEHQFYKSFYEQNSVEPSDELWAAIHAQIKKEDIRKTSWKVKFPDLLTPVLMPAILRQIGFAALLVLVSVGLTSLYFASRKPNATTTAVITLTPEANKNQPAPVPTPEEKIAPPIELVKAKIAAKLIPKPVIKTADRKVNDDELLTLQIAKAGREYQSAIKLLNRAIAKRQNEYDEGTRLQYQASLGFIDQSIASSRQALKQHPNDASAAQFLLTAYSKKVELMQEIALR
jgi:tetratricopeptide (TPR) repeat protein